MALAGAGLGGMSIAEAYTTKKMYKEKTKRGVKAESTKETAEKGARGLRKWSRKPSGWFSGKPSLKKDSARVSDLLEKQ